MTTLNVEMEGHCLNQWPTNHEDKVSGKQMFITTLHQYCLPRLAEFRQCNTIMHYLFKQHLEIAQNMDYSCV